MSKITPVLILGAGGVGLELIDLIDELNRSLPSPAWKVQGFLDDRHSDLPTMIHDLPVRGPIAPFPGMESYAYANAIGHAQNRKLRRLIRERFPLGDENFPAWIHPRAFVSRRARVGAGTIVNVGVSIGPGCEVGRNAFMTYGTTLAHECVIGDHAVLTSGVNLSGRVKIGASAYMGVGSSVIHDRTIGEEALVGAGTMVAKDVPARIRYLHLPKLTVLPDFFE